MAQYSTIVCTVWSVLYITGLQSVLAHEWCKFGLPLFAFSAFLLHIHCIVLLCNDISKDGIVLMWLKS